LRPLLGRGLFCLSIKIVKSTARLFVILCLLLSIPGAWFAYFALTPLNSNAQGDSIEIHRSDSHAAIIKELVSKRIINQPSMFNWLGRITRQWRRVKAGEYEVSPAMSPLQIFSTITSGISIIHPVTVREGENMYEIADDIGTKNLASKEEFLSLCNDTDFITVLGFQPGMKTLEGFLYPDTYYFNRTMSAEDMVKQMVRHSNQMWTPSEQSAASALGMNRYQIVTLASIIEKETGAPQERPIISSVFHNRLQKKMRLQSDPTTIYGMWDRYKGKIHKTDLSTPSPYNTYTVPALPEGPIANPGKEAIEAALHPSTTDYLFFVSHNNGTHEFTRSLDDHNRAVRKFQLDPKAREGKSWRDLNKKPTSEAPQ
jgi:UPF0755 protein